MYLLKLSLRSWRLAPWSQLFSAFAVGFLLLLVGFLFWMQQGLKTVLVRLRGEQVITAYINPTVERENESKLVDTIRVALGSENISELQVINQSDFLGLLKGQYPDLVRELEDLGQEMTQIVPRYISISGVFQQSTLEKIRDITGIDGAESSRDRYRQVVGAFSALRWVARVLMVGICLALLTGLIHLSRMNGYLHQDALTLLKFWGAKPSTLVAPGIISGLTVGLLGGAIALAGWLTVGVWLGRQIGTLSALLKGLPPMSHEFGIVLFLCGGMIGLSAGIFGSLSGSFSSSKPVATGGHLG